MKHEDLTPKHKKILIRLSGLPKKILALHGADNTTEFVLHELCGSHCFNLPKAAYFVDNPDFNCCKGVAGYCKTECLDDPEEAWQKPEPFSCHMQNAKFNQKVRELYHASIGNENLEKSVQEIAQEIGIEHPTFYTWELKNGNKGLLIFEQGEESCEEIKTYLEDGLSLLGFCPIF